MTLTAEVRTRLRMSAKQKQYERRRLIDKYYDRLIHKIKHCKFTREVRGNKKNGMVMFHYQGKHVQYFVGAQKMIVRNAVSYTVYDEFPVASVFTELDIKQPRQAFKLIGDNSDG